MVPASFCNPTLLVCICLVQGGIIPLDLSPKLVSGSAIASTFRVIDLLCRFH
jgi:hypothetical protein